MLILVLGANNICSGIAAELCNDGHDVCVISEHATSLQHLQQFIDCQTIVGCPSHPHVLRQANAEQADMIIAATKNDEMNMVACQVAYSLFGIKRKIAFISNEHYLVRHDLFGNTKMPIDTLISLDNIISEQISELIAFSAGALYTSFPDSKLCMTLTTVKTQAFINIMVSQSPVRIIAIFRNQKKVELTSETNLEENDDIIFICHKNHIDRNISQIHGPPSPNGKIVIGAEPGVIDAFASSHKNLYIKAIEPEISLCEFLASKHSDLTVLNGHITEYELLSSENMNNADMFCAITEDDEDNIMAALQAKNLGAKKTIAMVNKEHYKSMLEHSTIDFIVDPKTRVLEQVLNHIKHPWIRNIHKIHKTNYKVLEICNSHPIPKKVLSDFSVLAYINNEVFEPEDIIPANTTIIALLDEACGLGLWEKIPKSNLANSNLE